MVLFSFLPLLALAGSALAQVSASAAPAPVTNGFTSGFNLASVLPDGQCRTVDQWADEFRRVQSFSTPTNNFNNVKLFTASYCDQALNAAQAALQTGVKVWQGIWAGGGAYQNDLDALARAIEQYGTEWLAGINVGSEELYRGDMSAEELAGMITNAKKVLQQDLGATNVPIGTADTWTAFVRPENQPAIQASDIIMVNAFPYWQSASIQDALPLLQEAIQETVNVIGGKPFILGETGWPSAGTHVEFSSSVASVQNAADFWRAAACYLTRSQIPFYWFEAFDEPNKAGPDDPESNFGVATVDGKLKFSLQC
ncbi:glycoside hydrolase [Ascobolus immersus RN42]|uniref:Probable glucan endo-1,3-beta-glucosidase eglC n=1 Tax=Ascobolus immersus RN42 TaxID=1160509 RepID=A0A3N4I9K3_ASCIM|nr:glycoside hydrolase [Ascobolus immersus RN42]